MSIALGERTLTTPCQQSDEPDLWFAERPADIARAQELCSGCPFQTSCLAGALERREPWGVWGGRIVVNGVVVAAKRGRGRPRKDATKAA
ncbi:MAG TPA: WhiB family transcriptional regulator [Actinomycetaceae bacterium]|nr:WhiB family transcriptional regulator [Actinomycetaceae bacterium]